MLKRNLLELVHNRMRTQLEVFQHFLLNPSSIIMTSPLTSVIK